MQNKVKSLFNGKSKIIIIFFAVLVLNLVVSANVAHADGGIFYPVDKYASETAQKAFIYYQNQTENLVISTSYQGNAKDFAWVIPTPSKPEIFKSDSKLFATLGDITKTINTGPDIIYDRATMSLGGAQKSPAIEIVEQKTVDIYDTTILQATDSTVLAKWLADNGYTFPADKSSMLQDYIDNGWYFTVAKIQGAFANNADVAEKLATGEITPLRLSFQTNKIIYPMKLTRLALDFVESDSAKANLNSSGSAEIVPPPSYYKTYIPITLYVLSDGKVAQGSLTTQWANWIGPNIIKSLDESMVNKSWINSTNKLFLTKLSDTVNIKNVDDDFLITKASSNEIYPLPVYKTSIFWLANLMALIITLLVAIFLPISLIFIIILLLQVFVIKSKWIYILGSIYEVLVCLCSPIIWLAGYLSALSSSSNPFLLDGFAGFSLGLLLVFAATLFFTVKMIRRYRSKKYQKMFKA